MISQLRGILLEKQPPYIVIDVHGVGYEVAMPMTCFYSLPENGEMVTLLTHFVVREDAQLLYGFNQASERTLFCELIKVNGVGPKLALAILSGLSAAQFVTAVEREEISTLVKLPGVGKKTAERLIIEMRDRLKSSDRSSLFDAEQTRLTHASTHANSASSPEEEAILALITLGYKPLEAKKWVTQVADPALSCEDLIKAALKRAL